MDTVTVEVGQAKVTFTGRIVTLAVVAVLAVLGGAVLFLGS